MKNYRCLVFLLPVVGLGFLGIASALGFSFPFALVAAHLVGFTCATGVLAIFLKDYAPRRRYPSGTLYHTAGSEAGTAQPSRPVSRPSVRPARNGPRTVKGNELPAFGLVNNPATLSIS
jgi:hypothetical protein